MSRITRDSFVESKANQGLDVAHMDDAAASRLAAAGLSRGTLADIAGADGVIQGEGEMNALFRAIDGHDRNGRYGSIDTTRTTATGREQTTASGAALAALQREIADARMAAGRPASGAAKTRQPGIDDAGPNDPTWLKTAFGEWGVQETKGTKAATPRILEYFSATWAAKQHTDDSGKSNAWCAAFVTWSLGQNDVKNGKAVGARAYETWGEPSAPFRGAIVTMEHKGQKHVGMIVGVDKEGNYAVLGGNQENEVNIKSAKGSTILAIRKPEGYEVPPQLQHLPTIDVKAAGSTR